MKFYKWLYHLIYGRRAMWPTVFYHCSNCGKKMDGFGLHALKCNCGSNFTSKTIEDVPRKVSIGMFFGREFCTATKIKGGV